MQESRVSGGIKEGAPGVLETIRRGPKGLGFPQWPVEKEPPTLQWAPRHHVAPGASRGPPGHHGLPWGNQRGPRGT